MEIVIPFVLIGGVVLAVVSIARSAEALGLRRVPGLGLHAEVEGIVVAVERERWGVVRIRAVGRQPSNLRIRPEVGADKSRGTSDVETGDPGLDAVAVFDGEPEDLLRSRLDADTRRAILGAVGLGARLSGGEWTLEVDSAAPLRLEELTRAVVAAARALAVPDDPRGRLARIAATDPEGRVRLHAVRCLLGRRPDPAEVTPFLRDRDPRIAVMVARTLGEVGRDVLRAALESRDPAIRRSAALGVSDLAAGPGRLEAEEVLVSRLGVGEPEVIDALARIGSARAVRALSRLTGGLGLTVTERRARDAIRAIQARLVGAERGTLAITASKEGRLSVARRRSTEP